MKYDLESPRGIRTYRLIVKGPEVLLYIRANSTHQAASLARKAGYLVLSVERFFE